MKSAVVVFPGSNCDRDLAVAIENVSGHKPDMVWHRETELAADYDLIGVPGGFSYGDYLRSGAMAAQSPVMRAVAQAAGDFGADRVIAEANNGGAMVGSVLRAVDAGLPVRLVHASRGKSARAEPVAALYESGRVVHRAAFPALEDELCGMIAGGGYVGPGRSPDRADALVWAMSELMLGGRGEARVRGV